MGWYVLGSIIGVVFLVEGVEYIERRIDDAFKTEERHPFLRENKIKDNKKFA